MYRIQKIINFWFRDLTGPKDGSFAKVSVWFSSSPSFNQEITNNFLPDLTLARKGLYDHWSASPEGSLALLILLDQFNRNLYPHSPKKYDSDPKAVSIALNAINNKFDHHFWPIQRLFFYLPFEHAENLILQNLAISKIQETVEETTGEVQEVLKSAKKFAVIHKDIIEKFGRFPGRNAILSRPNTKEEAEYLKLNPDSF
jgi:uncharacterized protein (DUF924 family)